MRKKTVSTEKVFCILFCLLAALYFAGICWVNLWGQQWYHYDVYADAMIAKYIAQSRSFFPEGWLFGNQVYVFATPAVAAVFYSLTNDQILATGLASCLMTLVTVLSFWWCIAPFVSRKSRALGVFCIVGGIVLGSSAAQDMTGLQLLYTMASYYACYLIGIFFTLGIWLRIVWHRPVRWYGVAACAVLNLALSMQSLREMLVLNLPLCVLSALVWVWNRKQGNGMRHILFSLGMLVAGLAGTVVTKMLTVSGHIRQSGILESAGSDLMENAAASLRHFLGFLGMTGMEASLTSVFEFVTSVFLACLVIGCAVDIIRRRECTPLSAAVIFCVISLGAVFCAGVLVINLRPAYFFVWRVLTTLALVYWAERITPSGIRTALLLCAILIGTVNFAVNFGHDLNDWLEDRAFYRCVAAQLEEEQISHIFYDNNSVEEAPFVGAFSGGRIICGTFFMNKNHTSADDLVKPIPYLQSESWFEEENIASCYILIGQKRWDMLAGDTYADYREELLSHLELVHHFTHKDRSYYLYAADAALLQDLTN